MAGGRGMPMRDMRVLVLILLAGLGGASISYVLIERMLTVNVEVEGLHDELKPITQPIQSRWQDGDWKQDPWTMTVKERRLAQNARTLVVLLGNARGGEDSWESLYSNLLEPNNADLALMLGETPNKRSSLYQKAKYQWSSQEFADWGEALDSVGGDGSWRAIARNNSVAALYHALGGTKPDPIGNGVVIPYQRWLLRNLLVDGGLLKQYDRFVITRTDHIYACPLILEKLNMRNVWIPEGEDYGVDKNINNALAPKGGFNAICDRFIVCSQKDILNCLDTLEPMIKNAKDEPFRNFIGNPEALVYLHYKMNGILGKIQRMPRNMMLMKEVSDSTKSSYQLQWRPELTNGLEVKYMSEYRAVRATCEASISSVTCEPAGSQFCLKFISSQTQGHVSKEILSMKAEERTLVIYFDYKQENPEKWAAMKKAVFRGLDGGGPLVDMAVVVPTNAKNDAYPPTNGVFESGSVFDWATYIWEVRDAMRSSNPDLHEMSLGKLQVLTELDNLFWDSAFDNIAKGNDDDPDQAGITWRDLPKSFLGGTSLNWKINGDSFKGSTQANIVYQKWYIKEKIMALKLREKYSKFIVVNADYHFGCPCQPAFTTPYKYSDDTARFVEHRSWVPQTTQMDFMVCSSFWISQCLAAPQISHPRKFKRLEGDPYQTLKALGHEIMQEIGVERMCPQGKELVPIKTPGSSMFYPEWPECKTGYLERGGQFRTTYREGFLKGIKGLGSDDIDFPKGGRP